MKTFVPALLAATMLSSVSAMAQDAGDTIVAAVLPSSRAVQTGETATAFATIINAGSSEAVNCRVEMSSGAPAGSFSYQTTDAANVATGTPDTPANIAPGAAQSFVFAFTPSAEYAGGDLPLVFICDNRSAAPQTPGVNSFWMSASNTPGADIVAVSDSGSAVGLNSLPGVVETIDRQQNGAFVVAISSVGSAANLTARPVLSHDGITVTPSICQTDPGTGSCLEAPAASVDFSIGANATASFAVFIQDEVPVAYDPANNRVAVLFEEGGALRGSTSLAVRTLMSEPVLPQVPFLYADADRNYPLHYLNGPVAAADNTPIDNNITNPGAALGRVLFYDRRLSANNTTSCATCHTQATGFSDPLALSIGFDGQETERHSPGLSNGRYYENGHFFWDERADTLEDQTLIPIQSDVEMGLTLDEAVARVAAEGFYADLFTDAFGDAEVTADRMARAMAQFVRSLTSFNSTFDQALNDGPLGSAAFQAHFTDEEYLGLQLFMPVPGSAITNVGCGACHNTLAHVSDDVHNIGLDAANDPDADPGNGLGEFKSPSLRNVAVRTHFMHDGRFTTLAEVIEHYNSGVIASPNLDPRLRNGRNQPQRLNLTAEESAALEAFLHTLTDNDFLTDPRFSDPFVD
ncbi:cytochrome c peroxidase [Hyphobacterium sp. HN65]|uniref:Cytochrome c peroxidase n=1 Tax=Hyphobacterium lacteum TaxID=3116575 RepID=A0ABU7LRL9_9PROT|nr:cytochrome c peroxidase [Hyphobacterium sp. HN65]MEE2526562.1 cytochrome c peroxidase [Hyphobacterium sp. HN65]